MSSGRSYCSGEVLPLVAMVAAQITAVGSSTVYKAAVSKGGTRRSSRSRARMALNPNTFPTMEVNIKTQLPPLTYGVVFKFFVLGTLGYVGQYFGTIGIALSSPTLATAMSNLTPATTFILAVFFRMEKIEPRSWSSQAKIIGTLLSITGAFVVVLYNGPAVISSSQRPHSISIPLSLHDTRVEPNWVAGGVFLAAEYIIVSIWYTYQAKVIREYPAEMVLVLFYNVACTIYSAIDCFINEPNFEAWKLKPDIHLISIIYAGTLGSGLSILVHTWCLHVKGPVYVALFLPMTIAIAAIMGVILLGDTLYLGCIIGSIIISMGFYTVIWGKSREETNGDKSHENNVEESCIYPTVHLLHEEWSIYPTAPLLHDFTCV